MTPRPSPQPLHSIMDPTWSRPCRKCCSAHAHRTVGLAHCSTRNLANDRLATRRCAMQSIMASRRCAVPRLSATGNDAACWRDRRRTAAATRVPRVSDSSATTTAGRQEGSHTILGAVRSWSGLAFSVSTSDGWNVPSRGAGRVVGTAWSQRLAPMRRTNAQPDKHVPQSSGGVRRIEP